MIARRRQTGQTPSSDNINSVSPQNKTTRTIQSSPSPKSSRRNQAEIELDMTCRDRSNEFLSAVKLLQSRQGNGLVMPKQRRDLRARSEFNVIAKRIGRDLANTFAKLEKLTLLAKRKSLFDDKPVEIQELTYIIKQDINSLNKQIAQLQELSRSQRAQNGKHARTHSNSVVVALQSKLASMSNDFKGVLEVRTENLKHQKERREQFSQAGATNLPPSSMAPGGQTKSLLYEEENRQNGGSDFAINMDDVDKTQYQNQLQIVDQQDAYIQSRADTMQNIESTIVELGSIFTQLAHMVQEQEEMVGRIDANIEDTQMNIEAAHSEILKYFQSVTSNRWLMIKIFGVLIIFFIIFVVFMA